MFQVTFKDKQITSKHCTLFLNVIYLLRIITCTQYVLYVTVNTQVPHLSFENLNDLFSFKLEKPVTLQIQICRSVSSEVRLIVCILTSQLV